jgi:hypothetical protein
MSISISDRLAEILLRHDPISIYFPEYKNTDEYTPEARDIAQRLSTCTSQEDCLDLIYESFVRYFGSSVAGERDRYVPIATDVWRLRQSS